MATAPAIRVQNWGDALRLPTFQTMGTLQPELATFLAEVDPIRTRGSHTPVPFQSKHLPALKRGLWHALRRPTERVRQGLLCLWPAQKWCVYISGDAPSPRFPMPRMALLRLRVDPQFFMPTAGLTVFAATLCPAARRLWVEDIVLWKGRALQEEESFTARWRLAAQWLEHYCIVEPRLVDGLELVLGRWGALETVQPTGPWFLQSDDPGRRPLFWSAASTASALPEPPSPVPVATAPKLDVGPLVAVATRESGPDQWALTASDGVVLGRALIRTLDVSSALRSVAVGRTPVEVEWNTVFQKWEIKAIAGASDMPSPGSFFSKPQ